MKPSLLQQILGPVAEEEFIRTYWQKRSLLVQNRDTAWPFSFDREAFFASLEACYHLKMAYKSEDGGHREIEIEPEQARKLYQAGHTICATRVNYGTPDLQRYLDLLQDSLLGSEFQMNSYLSPNGSGFGVHYDYHSVWIMQVEGSKRWLFADEPIVQDPVMNCVYPMSQESFAFPWYTVPRPDVSTFREVILEPGDLLYLPTGTWHTTEANGYSLSITMGHEPVRAATFITDLLGHHLWKDVESRRHLPFVPDDEAHREEATADLRDAMGDALSAMQRRVSSLTVDHLMKVWEAKVEAERKKRSPTPVRSSASKDGAAALLAMLGGANRANGSRKTKARTTASKTTSSDAKQPA